MTITSIATDEARQRRIKELIASTEAYHIQIEFLESQNKLLKIALAANIIFLFVVISVVLFTSP